MCTEELKTELWKHDINTELRWRTMQVEEKYMKYTDKKSSSNALQIKVVASDQIIKGSRILKTFMGLTMRIQTIFLA